MLKPVMLSEVLGVSLRAGLSAAIFCSYLAKGFLLQSLTHALRRKIEESKINSKTFTGTARGRERTVRGRALIKCSVNIFSEEPESVMTIFLGALALCVLGLNVKKMFSKHF